jgi:hypothetical protein
MALGDPFDAPEQGEAHTMNKIASPTELHAELSALLRYAQSATPSRARIARKLEELSERVAAASTMNEAYLMEVANLFTKAVAKTRAIMGTPEVDVRGDTLYLTLRLQPYNESKVDSLYVTVTDGHKVKANVHGQYVPVGVDVESQGFGQVSAEAKFEFRGEPVAKFVQRLGKLAMTMS